MMPLPSAWASPVVPGSCAVMMNARPASAQTAPAASLASRLTRLVRCLLAVDRPCASLMCPLRLLASSPASIPWGASCGPPGRWEAVESNGRLRRADEHGCALADAIPDDTVQPGGRLGDSKHVRAILTSGEGGHRVPAGPTEASVVQRELFARQSAEGSAREEAGDGERGRGACRSARVACYNAHAVGD